MLGSVKNRTKAYSVSGEWARTTTQKGHHRGEHVELTPRTMFLHWEGASGDSTIPLLHTLWRSGAQVVRAGEKSPPISAPQEGYLTAGGLERDVVDHHHLPLPGTCYLGFGMVRAPGPCMLVKLPAAFFFENSKTAK